MDKQRTEELLKGVSQEDLISIIWKMTACSREAENVLISWGRKNAKAKKGLVHEAELQNLWSEAKEIISEFNEYGGGPEDEEEVAGDNIERMIEIVNEHPIAWEIRKEILDEMLCEFEVGNSGFDDQLIDAAEEFCQSEEETRYLADQLSGGNSGFYKSYAAQLYQEIGDEERFLQIRFENLNYASDYIEVAEHYAGKGDHEKELEYIWKGLKECRGRLDELIDYAAWIYREQKNEAELRRLYDVAIQTKWDLNIAAIARHLYAYAKEKGDYDSQKKMLLLLLDVCQTSELKTWFDASQRELSEEDWKKEYPGIMEIVRKKDRRYYLDICMETGREAEVLKYLQSEERRYDYWNVDSGQYFSKRLFSRYPDEILALYWRDVHTLLLVTKNRNYEMATDLLTVIRSCMKQMGKMQEWNRQFEELKEKHKKKRNFIAMVQKL